MRRHWIGVVILVVLIVGAVGAASNWGDGDWGPNGHTTVTRIDNADGSAIAGGNTVVIETNRGGSFFFPFGFLLLLLLFFGFFAFMRRGRRFSGRPGWGRHGMDTATPPPWFDDWHRRAHERDATTGPTPPPDTSSPQDPPEAPTNQ